MKLSKQFKEDVANAAKIEETLHRRPYTIATVTLEYEGRVIVAAGLATCGKRDVWSDDLGSAIAIGRAKHNLAKKLAAIQMRQAAIAVKQTSPGHAQWEATWTLDKLEG
jgi:hypothetical protein